MSFWLARARVAIIAVVGGGAFVGASAVGASAATAGQSTVATAKPAVEVCGLGPAVVKPASVILTCADGRMVADGLHWKSWTSTGAAATATVVWQEGGSRKSTTTDITLSAPAREPGGKVLFTRLGMQVTGATPRGFIRKATFSEAPVPAVSGAKGTAPGSTGPAKPGERASSAKPAASGGSGTIPYANIAGYWEVAGGPNSVAQTAAAITGAESSTEPGAIQADHPYSSTGWGLWQITPGDSEPAYGIDYQMLDPWNNAEAAVAKYDAAGGFSPWTTYVDGLYEQYLPAAEANSPNTDLTDPGQFDPTLDYGTTQNGSNSDPGATYGPAMPGTTRTTTTETAFQSANTHLLWIHAESGNTNTGRSMYPGTSPSIATDGQGNFEAAFEDDSANHYLNVYTQSSGTDTDTDTGLGEDNTSSPSITYAGGQFVTAFESNEAGGFDLYVYTPTNAGHRATALGMAPETSPSITPGGGTETIQGSTSQDLWIVTTNGNTNTGLGVASGTSPSTTN
jgi:hypothetical protein